MIMIRSRRRGFTLIELMAVIAIIAMLAAITAGGINRVRSAQMARNTEQTATKLQVALDQQWKAIADRVMQDKVRGRIPAEILNHCGKDLDRAAALWMYIQTRREMPQTFVEAQTPIGVGLSPMSIELTRMLQPKQTFQSATGGGLTPEQEAAALLYMILAEQGNSGTSFSADDGTQGAQGTIGNFRVFMDAWRTPITFVRYARNAELNQSPFVRPGSALNDPLDPTGKLPYFSSNPLPPAATAAPSMLASFGVPFDNQNRQPAVISFGPNLASDGAYGMDNVVGYRLRRQGNRGD